MPDVTLAGLSILVVEDERLLCKQIAAHLEKLDADVTGANTVQAAKRFLANLDFDLVLLDVNLPDGRGTDLLKEHMFPANTGVIVMTAEGAISGAVEAMRLGALDYLVKPFDPAQLPLVVGRAQRNKRSARLEEHRQRDTADKEFFFGKSLADLEGHLQKIIAADNRVQDRLPPVLIQGETGTGKTTIARRLHRQGPRASQPLVEVNCSTLPETLAESELFGHERGAFTDARAARMGLFEAANGGALFLDELPSLSPAMQAKVLTAIEDRKIRRLGGTRELPIDVRIIAATNRDLKQLVAEGKFRPDLFHRLDLFRLHIPPLRERGDDILRLAETFLTRLRQRHHLPRKAISESGKKRLLTHPWPGNVRELSHEIERAIVFSDSDTLDFEHLETSAGGRSPAPARADDWFNPDFTFPAAGFLIEEAINRLIQHALKQTGQNVSAAARLLGVSRDYLRYRLFGKQSGKTGD